MKVLRRVAVGVLAAMLATVTAANAASKANAGMKWKESDLAKALSASSRPQADRDRDAERKPAQLMTFFGVEKGMTTLDVIGAAGYVTGVLAVTVGPKGKVYLQNPAFMLKMRGGAVAKAIDERLAGNKLPNVVRVDGDLPNPAVPDGSVDVAITAMNLHDIYNRGGAPAATAFMKNIYAVLKPGGVFGVVDHIGNPGADNAKLHRMTKEQAIEVAKAAGFVVEAESNVLANPTDDHTKIVFDPSVRGKTDQFTLRLRKPKM